MKTTHTLLLGFAATMMLTQGAQAQTPRGGVQPPPPPARTVFYVGGSLGHTSSKEDTCSGVTIPCDRRDTNWGVQMGVDFNRFIAAEVAYRNLGKIQEQNDNAGRTAEVRAKALEAVVIAGLPVEKVTVYVKGGAYRAKSQLKSTFLTEADTTNTNWTMGAGVRYDVFQHLGLRLEYQRYNNLGSGAVGFRGDADTLSLGAVIRF
jgi:opacity protein-like surface antigen